LNNIILALNVVFPLLLMMSVGYFLRILKITDTPSLNVMNRIVFRVFLPLLLFLNIYSIKTDEIFNPNNSVLILLIVLCVLGITLLLHLLLPYFIKDRKKISVVIQGIFRSNLIIFGIPIAVSIYGENHIGVVSLLAAIVVPLYNVLAVIVLEYYREGVIKFKAIILGVVKNPLVLASFIGFLFLILKLHIPGLILSPLNSMSKVATPLAFVVLGGAFRFEHLSKNTKYLSLVTLSRLIFFPAFVFILAILLGFRNEALVALIGAAASPTAVSSFTMAMEMDADGELAGQIVVVTSIASILTIFIWVLLLGTWHFI